MYDVISLGTATYDVFLKSKGLQVGSENGEKDICVRYGAKLEVDEIYFDSGGGGTNSSTTFSRQGLKCASVIQIGNDYFGDKIKKDLEKEGVDIQLINTQDGYTDYSTVLWAPDGGRTILVYRGKTKLEENNIMWDKLTTNWCYVSSLEGNLDVVERLIKNRQTNISFNPGGRELEQKDRLLSILEKITVLNVNKEEMEELLQVQSSPKEFLQNSTGQAPFKVQSERDGVLELLKRARELPCEYIVITDDRRGAFLWNKRERAWYHSGIFEDSPRVETTGAGDAFGSGLMTGLIKGCSIKESLYIAAANASSVVAHVGAKKGILSENDLKNWDRNKLKIEKITV